MSEAGQKIVSAIVDIVFFAVVGVLGWHHVLSEAAILSLFSIYATNRFVIGNTKQMAAAIREGGGGGSGWSTDRFKAVSDPAASTRRVPPADPAPPSSPMRRTPPVDPRRDLRAMPDSPIVLLGQRLYERGRSHPPEPLPPPASSVHNEWM